MTRTPAPDGRASGAGRRRIVLLVALVLAVLALALWLTQRGDAPPTGPAAPAAPATTPVMPSARPSPPPPTSQAPSVVMLTPEGIGGLRIGTPARDIGEGFVADDDATGTCVIYTSPRYRGAWVMVEDGIVRRVSVGGLLGQADDIATASGIRVGATEAAVRAAHPDLREEGHEYVAPPAKNLYTAATDRPGLRFEIDDQGRVSQIHGGQQPQLSYSEGCS